VKTAYERALLLFFALFCSLFYWHFFDNRMVINAPEQTVPTQVKRRDSL